MTGREQDKTAAAAKLTVTHSGQTAINGNDQGMSDGLDIEGEGRTF